MMFGTSVHDRATSGFPLSISTGLAMESIFQPKQEVYDKDRKPPQKIALNQYQEIWINIFTLFRNLISACDKAAISNTGPQEISDVLEMEIDTINGLFGNEGNNLCQPRYYVCDYQYALRGMHHSIQLRNETSTQQLMLKSLWEGARKKMVGHTDEIYEFKPEIKPPHKSSSMILTHIPYDLLSYTNFHKLDLLESNTGKLKTRRQWNSKYYPVGKSDLSHLPFIKMLLMVFGDKTLIQPGIYKLREQILEASVKRHWNPLSTREKLLLDLSLEIKEAFVLEFLRGIGN